MKVSALTALIYGLLVAGGGLMGYRQAQSLASLVSGLIFGVAILASGWWIAKGAMTALCVALALAAFLALFFGYRFVSAGKFMPAGMMTIASLLALFFLLLGWYSEG